MLQVTGAAPLVDSPLGKAVAFNGKGYQWTQDVDIAAGRDAVLELTAENADVGAAPAPYRAIELVDLARTADRDTAFAAEDEALAMLATLEEAGAADRQVADADHRPFEVFRRQSAGVIQRIAQANRATKHSGEDARRHQVSSRGVILGAARSASCLRPAEAGPAST